MMDVHDEKAAVAGEDTDSSRPVFNAATTKDFRATDTTEPRKRVQHISEDQYPHGLKLVTTVRPVSSHSVSLYSSPDVLGGAFTDRVTW
jgi:hypothetical protein